MWYGVDLLFNSILILGFYGCVYYYLCELCHSLGWLFCCMVLVVLFLLLSLRYCVVWDLVLGLACTRWKWVLM